MTLNLQAMLTIFVEISCCKIFYETFSARRNCSRYLSYLAVLLIGILSYGIVFLLADHFMWKEISIIIVMALLMRTYLEINLYKSLVLATIYQSLLLLVDYCGYTIFCYMCVDLEQSSEKFNFIFYFVILLCKLCLFLVVVLIYNKMKQVGSDSMSDSEWIRFVFIPIISIGMNIAMISEIRDIERPEQTRKFFFIAFGLIGINLFVFYLLNDVLKSAKKYREQSLYLLEAESQMKMYQSISQNYESQRRRTHEYKNQLMCMEGLLEQKEYAKAEHYIAEIAGGMRKELDAINTNHVIINTVLNSKYQEAMDKGILLIMKFNDLSKIQIEDTDIVVILSNLLNNAIEAVEKCKDNKLIKLKIVMEDDLIISIRNPYVEKPRMSQDRFLSSKEDAKLHGIGILNIVEAVNKYGGSYTIEYDHDEFFFSILIPSGRCPMREKKLNKISKWKANRDRKIFIAGILFLLIIVFGIENKSFFTKYTIALSANIISLDKTQMEIQGRVEPRNEVYYVKFNDQISADSFAEGDTVTVYYTQYGLKEKLKDGNVINNVVEIKKEYD